MCRFLTFTQCLSSLMLASVYVLSRWWIFTKLCVYHLSYHLLIFCFFIVCPHLADNTPIVYLKELRSAVLFLSLFGQLVEDDMGFRK